MIRLYVRSAVLLAAIAAAAYGLAAEAGPWPAFLTCAAVAAVACVIGALLLHTSGVGRVTWRNRLSAISTLAGRLTDGRVSPL